MLKFKSNKISTNTETVSEQLRKARQTKKLKLKDAAKKLNINLKYLKALENGEYNKLPTGIYGKKFLMEYAVYLGLNYNELIKTFITERNTARHQGQKELFSKQVIKKRHFLALPKIIKSIVIIIVITICFIYLGFGLKKIIAPPYLFIYSPEKNFITQNRFIKIIGKAEKEARIVINGATILSDAAGEFTKTVNLKNGINIITITAYKKYGRNRTVIRQVLVK